MGLDLSQDISVETLGNSHVACSVKNSSTICNLITFAEFSLDGIEKIYTDNQKLLQRLEQCADALMVCEEKVNDQAKEIVLWKEKYHKMVWVFITEI